MRFPRVSIITPSLNQAEFLENTILSVLQQQYPNLEYMILDGGSSDGSLNIIQKYAKHLSYWQSCPDEGQVNAINQGFQRASGIIYSFLNSDDFLMPGAIHHLVEMWRVSPQAAGWVGGCHAIDKEGFIIDTVLPKKLGKSDLLNWESNWFYQPACFFSARIAHEAGLFNPQYDNAFDFDFWLRLIGHGILIPTPQIIACATLHSKAKTQKRKLRMFQEVQAIQRFHGDEQMAACTQLHIDRAARERPASAAAKLIFTIQKQKAANPHHYVQFPAPLSGLEKDR